MKFGIIGAGIVGTAIAICLQRAGGHLVGVKSRSEVSIKRFNKYLKWESYNIEEWIQQADIVFITTQDTMIPAAAKELHERKLYKQGQVWIHCSGSTPANVLRVDEALPVKCLSIHPLQTFASVEQAVELLKGTHFGIEGDALDVGEKIVTKLGGIPHRLDLEYKALYHAGAAVASNYLVMIAGLAVELFEQSGVQKEDALKSLLPLMKGTLHNLDKVGIPQALTGPIARGDVQVIKSHLEQMPKNIKPVYKVLGQYTLNIGKAKKKENGLEYSKEIWEEMNRLFEKG